MKYYSRNDLIFLAVICLIHTVYFGLAWHYEHIFNGDSFEYIYEAINIRDYNFFYSGNPALPIEEEYKTLRTPGYPLFLLLVYSFVVNNWIVLSLQNLVSVFNIMLARHTLKAVGYCERLDRLLLMFIILFPSQFIYANTIAPDILLQTFCLVYFSHAIAFLKTGSVKKMLGMAVAIIVGLFIKPVLYPLAIIHCISFVIYTFVQHRRLTKSAVTAFIPILIVCFYCLWNQQKTGKFHFTSIQSFNAIYYYNNYLKSTKGTTEARNFLTVERSAIAALPSLKERYDYAQSRGLDLLKGANASYLAFHLKRSAEFFVETGKGEMDLFLGNNTLGKLYADDTKGLKTILNESGVPGLTKHLIVYPTGFLAILVLCANLVRLGGFVLFFVFSRQRSIIKWFIGLYVVYFAAITGPISNAHYVLPISLILMGCASIGLSRLLTVNNNRPIITQ